MEADDAKVKIQRVTAKLEGKDFNEVDENTNTLSVKDQVIDLVLNSLSYCVSFRLTGLSTKRVILKTYVSIIPDGAFTGDSYRSLHTLTLLFFKNNSFEKTAIFDSS